MAAKILLDTDTEILYRKDPSKTTLVIGGLSLLILIFLCAGANLYAIFQSYAKGYEIWTYTCLAVPAGLIFFVLMSGLVWNLAKRSTQITFSHADGRLVVIEQSLTITGQVRERLLAQFSRSISPQVKYEQQGNTCAVNIAAQGVDDFILYNGEDEHLARHLTEKIESLWKQPEPQIG